MSTPGVTAHTELRTLIGEVWDQMGGRGTKADVVAHLAVALPGALREYLTERGLAAAVSGYFRAQGDDGLPQAPEIDEHGTHAQLELLDVGEWRYVVARYMASSRASIGQAKRAQERCLLDHGVLIDLEDPWAEGVSA